MACYLAVCACSELIFLTGALYFRASVTQTTNGEKIVRAFSITSSARNPPSGFRDPEGSTCSGSNCHDDVVVCIVLKLSHNYYVFHQ